MDLPDASLDQDVGLLDASPTHSMRLEGQSEPNTTPTASGQRQSPAQRGNEQPTITAAPPARPGTSTQRRQEVIAVNTGKGLTPQYDNTWHIIIHNTTQNDAIIQIICNDILNYFQLLLRPRKD